MRNLLLALIISVICLAALMRPWIGILGYVWFATMRPDVVAYAVGRPYSSLLAVATIVGSVRYVSRLSLLFTNPITVGVMLLQIPVGLSVIAAIDPTLSYEPYGFYIKVIILSMFIPTLLVSGDHLKKLVLVLAISLGFLGAKFGLFGVIHGGVRFVEGYGGFLSDNNAIALALAMAVPILASAREMIEQRWVRLGFLVVALLTMAGVVMTYSRGGALALGVAIAYVVLQSRRKAGLALMILVSMGYFISLVGESYTERMETMKNPKGESSSYARLQYAQNAIEIAKDYPVLGVGFGSKNQMAIQHNYVMFDNGAQVIHNTYLQMLTDSGVGAFALYVIVLFGTIIYLHKAGRRAQQDYPELAPIPKSLCGALLVWAVGSAFLSKVEFDLMYVLLMSAGAWYNFERAQRRQQALLPAESEEILDDQPVTV